MSLRQVAFFLRFYLFLSGCLTWNVIRFIKFSWKNNLSKHLYSASIHLLCKSLILFQRTDKFTDDLFNRFEEILVCKYLRRLKCDNPHESGWETSAAIKCHYSKWLNSTNIIVAAWKLVLWYSKMMPFYSPSLKGTTIHPLVFHQMFALTF